MSPHGSIARVWAYGREDTFCLTKIGHIIELEQLCGAGIFEIAARVESVVVAASDGRVGGVAKISDVRETIRLALLGGGKTAQEAQDITNKYVVAPYLDHIPIAYEILSAALVPPPGQQPGKAEADREAPEFPSSKMTENFPVSPSIAQGPDLAGAPA